eukprot:737389-Prorocentrum_lima.AAC.1
MCIRDRPYPSGWPWHTNRNHGNTATHAHHSRTRRARVAPRDNIRAPRNTPADGAILPGNRHCEPGETLQGDDGDLSDTALAKPRCTV